jgi:hypothetical protein
MPLFVADWDKQNGTAVVRVYVVAIDTKNKTVAVILNRKLIFDIPAEQITWDHWANG